MIPKREKGHLNRHLPSVPHPAPLDASPPAPDPNPQNSGIVTTPVSYRLAAVVTAPAAPDDEAAAVVLGTVVLWSFMSRSWGVRMCPADSSGGGGI